MPRLTALGPELMYPIEDYRMLKRGDRIHSSDLPTLVSLSVPCGLGGNHGTGNGMVSEVNTGYLKEALRGSSDAVACVPVGRWPGLPSLAGAGI